MANVGEGKTENRDSGASETRPESEEAENRRADSQQPAPILACQYWFAIHVPSLLSQQTSQTALDGAMAAKVASTSYEAPRLEV